MVQVSEFKPPVCNSKFTKPFSDIFAGKSGITYAIGKPAAMQVCVTIKMQKRLFAIRPKRGALSPIYVDPRASRSVSASGSWIIFLVMILKVWFSSTV